MLHRLLVLTCGCLCLLGIRLYLYDVDAATMAHIYLPLIQGGAGNSISSPTLTQTSTATASGTPTSTATLTETSIPTPTSTATAATTSTGTSTATQTATRTPSLTPTGTRRPTRTPQNTLTPSVTPTGTLTPSATPTATRTPRPTRTATTTSIGTPTGTPTATQTKTPTGRITYTLADAIYRIEAQAGATPQNISAALDAIAPGGGDRWLNTSPNGAWLLLETERFGCAPENNSYSCLAVVAGDLSAGDAIRQANSDVVHADGFAAVASSGNLVVYSTGGATHSRDLWAISRTGGVWNVPTVLTSTSPYTWNHQPAISNDGSKVLFDCGDEPYAATGTAICEVGTNGTGFRVVLTPADSPAELPETGALNHPDYAHDGSIIFEADWDGPQVWRLPLGGGEPVRVNADFFNENSPCVLPDGRIASTWGNREDNPDQLQELKVMAAGGNPFSMVQTDIDVLEYVGLGCGQ